jgi:hypothetical protein
MHNALSLLLITFGIPFISFAFGWSILNRFTDLDHEERFASAWGVGLAILGLAEFFAFLAHARQAPFNVWVMALMGAVALVCQLGRPRITRFTADFWWLAGLWALGVAHLVVVQALLPLYVGGDWWGDWSMHYQVAQVFLGTRSDDWAFMDQYTVASRTPLFNLVAAFGLSLSGDHFWLFQVFASWMNWCFALGLYLVLRDIGGARVGRFALLFAPLNLWMLHMAWFTWPKLLAAYFLLLGLHFYLVSLRMRRTNPSAARKRFLLFGVSSLLGIMSHSVGIVYLAPLALHAAVTAWRERGSWLRLQDFATLALATAVLLGPWHAWLVSRFGLEEISKSSPVTILKTQLTQGSSNVRLAWLGAFAQNLATSVLPSALDTIKQASSVPDFLYLYATDSYFNALLGAMTMALTAFLAVRMWGHWRRRLQPGVRPSMGDATDRNAIWLFIGIGCLGAAFLHTAPSVHGLAHCAFFPSAVLLVGLAWAALATMPRRWILAVGAGMLLEFLLMFWSHVWFTATPDFLDYRAFNASVKQDERYVFLNDLVGGAYSIVVATAIGIQTALVGLFIRVTTAGWPGPRYSEAVQPGVPATERKGTVSTWCALYHCEIQFLGSPGSAPRP